MKLRLTESQLEYVLKSNIMESCKTMVNEGVGGAYDNITEADLAQKYGNNFYVAEVPVWALPGLLQDYYEGLTDWQVMDIKGFKRNFITGTLQLPAGVAFEDICRPLQGAQPHMAERNDVGGKNCMCYTFAFPAR